MASSNVPQYWLDRILADEAQANAIADHISEEMAKMYRQQYLRVVKEVERLKAEIDYGHELTRTELWQYARWRKVEEELRNLVDEATRIDTELIHGALEREFQRVIGDEAGNYGGALGRGGAMQLSTEQRWRILSGSWSGEHYSTRVWKNTTALADRMKNEITEMLIDGKGTRDIRRRLMAEFGVCYHNADRLARTEVSYVHNQTTLARYKNYGNRQVQILIVEDGKACEVCAQLPGKPYDIDNPPFLPAHPRCRCCYAPFTAWNQEQWEREHPEEAAEQAANNPEKPERSQGQEAPKPLQNHGFSGIINEEAEVEKVHELIRSDATNKAINVRKQNAHIRESGHYVPGKSYLTITNEEAQRIVDELAGTGRIRLNRKGEWTHKEVVDAGRIVGVDVDLATGEETKTSFVKIHYAKDGVHIVPMRRRTNQ